MTRTIGNTESTPNANRRIKRPIREPRKNTEPYDATRREFEVTSTLKMKMNFRRRASPNPSLHNWWFLSKFGHKQKQKSEEKIVQPIGGRDRLVRSVYLLSSSHYRPCSSCETNKRESPISDCSYRAAQSAFLIAGMVTLNVEFNSSLS